jgi:hypothetical protein
MARGVHLYPRDVAVLELLLERRVETLDHIHQQLFANRIRKGAANRLGELARAGYITRLHAGHITPDGQVRTVYRLGPKGPAALRLRSPIAAEQLRDRNPKPLNPAVIAHQLAVNRVADMLGTSLTLERDGHESAGKHEPDGAYLAAQPDHCGRRVVLVEVDLGHYNRERILGKVSTFLADPDARSIIFAMPDNERASLIARWIRTAYGEHTMDRVQPLTFRQLQRGDMLDHGTEPADQLGRLT